LGFGAEERAQGRGGRRSGIVVQEALVG